MKVAREGDINLGEAAVNICIGCGRSRPGVATATTAKWLVTDNGLKR